MASRNKIEDEWRIAAIIDRVKLGQPYKRACIAGGISESGFHKWMDQGRTALASGDEENIYARFVTRVDEANSEAEAIALAVIHQAAQGIKNKAGEYVVNPNWTAKAWFLERRHPEEYARNRVELTGVNGGPIELSPPRADAITQTQAHKIAEVARLMLEQGDDDES